MMNQFKLTVTNYGRRYVRVYGMQPNGKMGWTFGAWIS